MGAYTFRDGEKIFITREGLAEIEKANTRNLELIQSGKLKDYAKFRIVDIGFDTNDVWVILSGLGKEELCYGIDELVEYILRDVNNCPFVSESLYKLHGNTAHDVIILNSKEKALISEIGVVLIKANNTKDSKYREELYFLDYWDDIYLVDVNHCNKKYLNSEIKKYKFKELMNEILYQRIKVVNLDKLIGKISDSDTEETKEEKEEIDKHIIELVNRLNFKALNTGYNWLGTEMVFVEKPDGNKCWYTLAALENM